MSLACDCGKCDECMGGYRHDAPVPTSHPLSEGPSPEAEAALEIVERWLGGAPALESRLGHQRIALEVFIAEGLTAAKRSAHLEDARAGCSMCAANVPVKQGDFGWHHYYEGEEEVYGCARPEVWDALSLSTPKGKE